VPEHPSGVAFGDFAAEKNEKNVGFAHLIIWK
jgi:hypothetical protein